MKMELIPIFGLDYRRPSTSSWIERSNDSLLRLNEITSIKPGVCNQCLYKSPQTASLLYVLHKIIPSVSILAVITSQNVLYLPPKSLFFPVWNISIHVPALCATPCLLFDDRLGVRGRVIPFLHTDFGYPAAVAVEGPHRRRTLKECSDV